MATEAVKSAVDLLGVPPAPRTGRDRLVATAVDLFYRNGFQAVGIDQVIAQAGVTKTTFYKHFESKDDLIIAAIQKRDEWETAAINRAIFKVAGDDPRRQLLGIFDVMDHYFTDPSFHGCMFLNATVEFPNPNDPIHKAAAAHKKNARDQWRDLARQIGADAATAEVFADCFTALFEGALILRQTHGRNDAARVVKPAAEQLMATYLPSVAPSKRKTPKA